MTLAPARHWALGICGAAGVAAAIISVVLVSTVVNSPQQVVAAMGERDIQAILGLMTDRLVSAVREIVRYL
jgi:hypothetical protein